VTFTKDSGTLDLEVAEGYEVKLCIKKASVDPAITGWLAEGSHSFDVPDFPQFPGDAGGGFSHYALIYRTVGTTTTAEVENTTITTGPTTTTDPGDTTTTDPGETTTTVEETLGSTIATSTTTDEVSSSTLPFTGSEGMVPLAASAAALLLLGMAVLRRA
jgi:hypothetical protein